jgi:hypothetical protein
MKRESEERRHADTIEKLDGAEREVKRLATNCQIYEKAKEADKRFINQLRKEREDLDRFSSDVDKHSHEIYCENQELKIQVESLTRKAEGLEREAKKKHSLLERYRKELSFALDVKDKNDLDLLSELWTFVREQAE